MEDFDKIPENVKDKLTELMGEAKALWFLKKIGYNYEIVMLTIAHIELRMFVKRNPIRATFILLISLFVLFVLLIYS
jgi:hypothetical protein